MLKLQTTMDCIMNRYMIEAEANVAKASRTGKGARRTSGGGVQTSRSGQEKVRSHRSGAAEKGEVMPERDRYTYTAFAHAQQIASTELRALRSVLRSKKVKSPPQKGEAERQPALRSGRGQKAESK
jgi:hypothetical protein